MNKAARSEKDAQNVAQIKTENERTRSPVAMRESLFLRLNNVSILYRAKWKKALRETQTLRAGRSKAGPKIFAPPQTPSRGRGTAKI